MKIEIKNMEKVEIKEGTYRYVETEKGFYIQRYVSRQIYDSVLVPRTSWLAKLLGLPPKESYKSVKKSYWYTFKDYKNDQTQPPNPLFRYSSLPIMRNIPDPPLPIKFHDSLEAAKDQVKTWEYNKETYPIYHY